MNLSEPAALSLRQKITAARRVVHNAEAVEKISALLDDVKPEIVHIHNIYNHLSPAILTEIHKRGIPIVMTIHDYHLLSPNYTLFHHGEVHEEDARGLHVSCLGNRCVKDAFFPSLLGVVATNRQKTVYRNTVSKFIAPSTFLLNLHTKYEWDTTKFVHIPHPVDAAAPHLNEQDNGTVVYVGRLSPEKGVDILIRAAAETPSISYVIAGDGPERMRLEALVQELHVRNVRFSGFLPGEKVKDLVRQARLTVLPARWYEVAPLSVLESLSLGTLAIGTDIGGIPEMLPPELLVVPNDPSALAQKIQRWHGAPVAERTALRTKLFEQVGKNHNPRRHVEVVTALYREVLSSTHV